MKNIKKVLAIISVVIISVALIGVFSACGEISGLIDDQLNNIGGGDDNENEEAVIEYTADDVKASMPSEYRITYHFTAASDENETSEYNQTITKASDGYVFDLDGNATMFKAIDGGYYQYTRLSAQDAWELTTVEDEPYVYNAEDVGYYLDAYLTFMTLYVGYEEDLQLGSTTTIAGRACTEYYDQASYGGSSYELHYYVDNAAHCCLKYSITGVVAGEGSGSVTWEVTEFATTGVELPATND